MHTWYFGILSVANGIRALTIGLYAYVVHINKMLCNSGTNTSFGTPYVSFERVFGSDSHFVCLFICLLVS